MMLINASIISYIAVIWDGFDNYSEEYIFLKQCSVINH